MVVLEPDESGECQLYTDGQNGAPLAAGPIEAIVSAARERLAGRRDLVLRLPGAAVFRRTSRLPVGAVPNLRKILELEIDQTTPFNRADVEFDYRLEPDAGDRKSVAVSQVIAKKTAIDAALQALGDVAPLVARIDAAGSEGVNLLQGRGPRARLSTVFSFVALAASIIAVFAAAETRQARIIAALSGERSALELETADVRAAAANARAAMDNSAALNERQNRRSAPLEIIAALTQILSDDAWLTELSLHQSTVSISGYGRSASAIIAAIEASEKFEGVETVAPITADSSGAFERFSLTFSVTPRNLETGPANGADRGGAQ